MIFPGEKDTISIFTEEEEEGLISDGKKKSDRPGKTTRLFDFCNIIEEILKVFNVNHVFYENHQATTLKYPKYLTNPYLLELEVTYDFFFFSIEFSSFSIQICLLLFLFIKDKGSLFQESLAHPSINVDILYIESDLSATLEDLHPFRGGGNKKIENIKIYIKKKK